MKYISFILLILIFAAALFAPYLTSNDPQKIDLKLELAPSSHDYPLGNDENGRDILSRLIYGSRVSLGIGLASLALTLSFGVFLGTMAGYYGGKGEKLFLMVTDIFQAFPGMLVAIAVAAFLQPKVINIILLLSVVGWVGFARLARAQALQLKNTEYVIATRSLGAKNWRIFLFHLIPNMAGPLMVQASFAMAGFILTESTLSFLGMGIPPEIPSWGKMLDSGSSLLLVAPQLSLFPGLAIMLTVLIFNVVGDFLKDSLTRSKA